MAIDYAAEVGWHEGEQQMQSLLHVPKLGNPTSHGLSSYGARILQTSPLLAIGTLDDEGLPWTTLLAGEPGFARYLRPSIIGVETLANRTFDPVLSALNSSKHEEEIAQDESSSCIMSGLAINLAKRTRLKLSGRLAAELYGTSESHGGEEDDAVERVQIIMKIEQSLGESSKQIKCPSLATTIYKDMVSERSVYAPVLADEITTPPGNCPKYLNKKEIFLSLPKPELVSDSLPLVQSAVTLLAKADLFFISSSYHRSSMGTNYRGGSPGFVRLLTNDTSSGTTLVYPEFSGNRFYQTLGNLKTNPLAGMMFPDFDSSDALYVTCTTEIIVGKSAAELLPRCNLVVKAKVIKARFVRQGLAFRGRPGEPSPYNPPVRYLTGEHKQADAQANNDRIVYAKLLKKDLLTPSIARLRFSITDPEAAGRWSPGQYVALAFEDELGPGYSHMNDDDPKSLNDDYVRTFTVSSAGGQDVPDDEFEITMRNVGVVTNFLFKQLVRAGLEVPLKGFGGQFKISQSPNEIVPFIAGGIGITCLLPHIPQLDTARLRLFWTINIEDIGLALDTFKRHPSLDSSTTLFVSGIRPGAPSRDSSVLTELERSRATMVSRRMVASDVQFEQDLSSTWYICTGKLLRQSLLLWLAGKEIVFEDFDY